MKRALFLILLAACGSKSAPAPAPKNAEPPPAPDAGTALPDSLRAEAESAIRLVEGLAVAAEKVAPAAEEDCPAVAAAMRLVADGPDGKAIHTIEADPEYQPNAEKIDIEYGAKLEAVSERLSTALLLCSYDEDVLQVLLDTGIVSAPTDE